MPDSIPGRSSPHEQRLGKAALFFALLVLVAVAQWLASGFYVPRPALLVGGLVLALGLLVLGSKILASEAGSTFGLRCTRCDATYANNSPFFTDLEANPRHLTVSDVPRPLGSSTFLRGKSVDYEPPKPSSRLPE